MIAKRGFRAVLALAASIAFFGATAGDAAAQQAGVVQGTVIDARTMQPVSSASVTIVGTQRGAVTRQDGTYRIEDVQPGVREVRVQRLGFTSSTQEVVVPSGGTVTADFSIQMSVIDIEAIVVTGVSGETSRAKLPFVVDRITSEAMPVPAVSAGGAIQGKIAGAQVVQGSGRPGSAPDILLRGPTSIDASGRSQAPLYIVDGVVLGSSIADIDALDIESVEVVKGAAASSLYGARAAHGVVQITTRSGSSVEDDRARFSVRSEYGTNSLQGSANLAQNHFYRLNDAGTAFVNSDGVEFNWQEEALKESAANATNTNLRNVGLQPVAAGEGIWGTFQDQPWPGGTFNHVDQLFDPGSFMQNQISVEGRSGQTNYHASFSNLQQDGVITGLKGYERNAFRVNLDQAVGTNFQLSSRTYYSRSVEDGQNADGGGPLFTLTRMPAGVNLTARDANGDIVRRPDYTGENANPLIQIRDETREDARIRFMQGGNLRWTPANWVSLDGNVSYDRSNVSRTNFHPVGFRTARSSSLEEGSVFRDGWLQEALAVSAGATLRQSFGDLTTRTQIRYSYEELDFDSFRASGTHLVVQGVPTVSAARENKITRSSVTTSRSEGAFIITNFDLRDRYIFDALVRRDGSSLFGADERWQTYYRGSAAWRVGEEDWFDFPSINEFKLRYSVGTAGGRPNFAAQYEAFSVLDGNVRAVSLGNRDLRPEFSIEHEAGIELVALDRFSFDLTYANTETQDQILQVPLVAATGFDIQWRNAGTLESKTWEAGLSAAVLQSQDFNWTARLLFDQTRQEITELNVPEYQYGTGQQGLEGVFYAREGEAIGTFYGFKWATSCSDLRASVQAGCDNFQVNDDGYLVWVGAGNSWRDGITGNLWGTTGTVAGEEFTFGQPIESQHLDDDGNYTNFLPIGKTTPDYSVSLGNTMSWGNFTAYGLLDAVRGVNTYNLPRHWSYFENYSGDQDQAHKSDETKKPIGYYSTLYRQLGPPNSHFVEDGSFVKLRELSLRYRMGQDVLAGLPIAGYFDNIALSIVGRNLYTWTDYSGFDPEVGSGGGSAGSAAVNRFDGFTYPNFRTFTFALEVGF